MSKLRFSFKQMVLYSLVALFILFLSESFLLIHVTRKNSEIITFQQNNDKKFTPLTGIYTKIDSFHNCLDENNKATDSFYELKLINHSSSDLTNWKLTIPLEQETEIKKVINAKVTKENNNIIFTPDSEYSNIIKANSIYYIQLYIAHKEQIKYTSLSLCGNVVRHIYSYPLHIIIVILSCLIIIGMIIYTLVYSYMKREIDVLNRLTKRSYAIIDQTMKTFVNFIDAKDQYTKGHSTRVAEYSKAIAKRMGYDEQFQQDMYYMGLMHDIGKITVPDSILNKTTHLSADEWAVIQLHTQNGANLLKNFTIIPEIRDAVLYHHERYDGKGYLAQLKGEEIPLCARIICVADSFDAMNTNRCYRLKYSKQRIINEFERCSARQFDPTIASIMIELISDGTIK